MDKDAYNNALVEALQNQRNNALNEAARWRAHVVRLEGENATLTQQLAEAMKAAEALQGAMNGAEAEAVEPPSDDTEAPRH